jgi:hypothetical protein
MRRKDHASCPTALPAHRHDSLALAGIPYRSPR